MPKLDFLPERDGWHFANSFENRIMPGVLSGISTQGLCGGMVMTALDYWRAGIPIPRHDTNDLPNDAKGSKLPDEASNLKRYIYDRQVNSLLTKWMFTRWITAPTITPNDFHNWAIGSEFAIVQQQINQRKPVMLGLWSMKKGDVTAGHQVLCYGWDNAPVRLYIYDPNNPDEETVLQPISPAKGCRVKGSKSGRETFYRGYFITDVYNWNENPPYAPPYRDVVITSGLNISPNSPDINLGEPLTIAVTVQNIGEYPSRFRSFCIWARDPLGNNIDHLVGGIESGFTALNPGQSKTIARNIPAFGTLAGQHTIGVAIESLQGHWQSVPVANSALHATSNLRLWPAKRKLVEQRVNVPESSRNDIDTGIILQPGDEFALKGEGMIWAGVWFTGLNGPEGWTDRIETNPNSPLHNTPDARPFSLVGRFENEGFFYIGNGITRRTYTRSTPKRLFLRINDNTPANGSGAFQCLIEVWR